ncbi:MULTISPECIES: TSUP family transporter [Micrococcaceae]|uniref:sulfite exporter TauE/SafE family protein n=1 Tax=Arthrobacter sp. S41 TaxID=2509721 RepID=UPI00103665D7|nr:MULTISPECIES: TSUP family transporter [Micrococcaceae]TAP25681.1 sulfite exporter TauE/SafE family protein [Arthrobacter sp. S41]UXN31616.1 TSUP family transporter [Glutamicibacter sp. M10]
MQEVLEFLSVNGEPVSLWPLALLLLAALGAGWIDAVVGGGGLIQLPALLLFPGITPVQALATNKLGSIFGTATSAVTYYRRTSPDLKTALPMAATALVGAFGGAGLATILPAQAIKPIIIAALIAVLLFTIFKPKAGELSRLRYTGRKHYLRALAIGLIIGGYDGMVGPGTGSFLIISMVTVLGYNFLQSSAKAKIVNLCTNAGALLLFVPTGHVLVGLGLAMGVMNMIGGYLGARMAISKGSGFIRIVFVVVVSALIMKLGSDMIFAG